MFGSGKTTVIISNEEMNSIMKIIKSLEESGLLRKSISKTIKNETKEQKEGLLSKLLGTLGDSLIGNLLAGKGAIATSQGRGAITAGEGTFRAGEATVRAGRNFNAVSFLNNFWNTNVLSKRT